MGQNSGVVVVISGSDEGASQLLDKIEERMRRTQSVSEGAAGKLGKVSDGLEKIGHAVPNVSAASGAIRELEGNLPIRAVERFLTDVLNLGPILQAAFPIVGGIAFAGMIIETINKIVEMQEAAKKAKIEMDRSFSSFVDDLKSANSELTITNDRLADEIAKISGHPSNGLKTGLDEATDAAAKLEKQLSQTTVKLSELMDKYKVGAFGGFFKGQGVTGPIEDATNAINDKLAAARRELDEVVKRANDSGDKGNAAQAQEQRLVLLNNAYSKAEKQVQGYVDALERLEKFRNSPSSAFGGESSETIAGKRYTSTNDNSKALAFARAELAALQQEEALIGGSYLSGQLKGDKASADAAKSADDLAKKMEEARQKLRDALAKVDEQAAQVAAARQKAQADADLAALEGQHKQLLITDDEYYRQRAAIQNRALEAEVAAYRRSEAAIGDQKRGLLIDIGKRSAAGDQAGVVSDEAKLVDLEAQRLGYVQKIEAAEGKIAKNAQDAANASAQAAQKRLQVEDELLAKAEALSNGSVEARRKSAEDAYQQQLKELRQQGVSQDALDAAAAIHAQEMGKIDLSSAQANQGAAGASISTRRRNVDYRQQTGEIGALEAQRERIALNREEATSLIPVLQAYEDLAAGGDKDAAAKVEELRERIDELKTPVDELAASVRDGLSGAFKSVWDQVAQGKNPLKSLEQQLISTFSNLSYQKYIEPLVQKGLGKWFPNGSQNGSSDGPLSQIGGAPRIPGMGGILSAIGLGEKSPAAISAPQAGRQITIVLQTDVPQSIASTRSNQNDDFEKFEVNLERSFSSGAGLWKLLKSL